MMAAAEATYHKQMDRERTIAALIPYSSHVNETTLATRNGEFVRTWRLAGISFEASEPDEILRRKNELNTLFRSIASNQVAIWTHVVRRRSADRLQSTFDNDFCRALDQKYFDRRASEGLMISEHYLSLVYRPSTVIERGLSFLAKRTRSEIEAEMKEGLQVLEELSTRVESSLRRYGADDEDGIERLGVYEDGAGAKCSSQLEFLNFLLTGAWQKVRVPSGPLHSYLGNAWIFVGAETLELRTPTVTRFAQAIDFKDYTDHTEPGILNGLLYEDYEHVITQSYSFMSKRDGHDFLNRQARQLSNSADSSQTEIDDIATASDQLANGQFAMGEYHFSLLVFGDTVEATRKNASSAFSLLQDQGFLAMLVTTATDAAFFAQLPGNWRYRPRIAGLTTHNFAGLSSFHNFRAGKRERNPWGPAVTLFNSPSGQPVYFNFHFSRGDENAYDRKLLGNTRIIGQSGSGKTTLLNFLLCQVQKFALDPDGRQQPFTTVFFDKDRGAELAIRAAGGAYFRVKNAEPTGFNPFQLAPTHDNIAFLERLVRTLVSTNGQTTTTADDAKISKAVHTVMQGRPELRRLSAVLQMLPEGVDRQERENSVAKRLARWCVDDGSGRQGEFWWVFDNAEDQIDMAAHRNFGIDGTQFLDNVDVRTPISMYLLHRLNAVMDGRRFIYIMDEAWKWVNDAAFSNFVGDMQLTIRKKNGLGVFSTQMPSSLLESAVGSALVQQVATEIYLPNPKADFHEYTTSGKGFGCTPSEYELIRELPEDSRMFLIKQGGQSVLAQLNLAGFDDELAILSGSADNLAVLDELIEEVGEDARAWLPLFHERRKQRKEQS